MVVKATATDTIMNYICDWQYQDFGFNALSDTAIRAKNIFHLFTLFDNSTFGHTSFKIKDPRLFSHDDSLAIINNSIPFDSAKVIYILTNTGVTGRGAGTESYTITICHDYVVCVQLAEGSRNSLSSSSGNGGCATTIPWTICTSTLVLEPGDIPTGGNSTPPTGSGGSSSGSSTPPDCGGGPTTGNRTESNVPCEPGWTPIEDNPTLLPAYVFDSLTKPCLKAILATLSGGITNNFFKDIYSKFDTSSIMHLFITEGDLTSDTAHGLSYAPIQLSTGGAVFEIKLDTVSLLTCSKEYIGYVMIHEVAHAAMKANIINWDTANSEHQTMMSNYLTAMATTMVQSFGISLYDAYSICYAGFNDGIDGNEVVNQALLLTMLGEVKRLLNDPSVNEQQLISRGNEFNQNGTAGTRGICN